MKAYECQVGDIVSYKQTKHRVKAISDFSVTLNNLVTTFDEIVDKHTHVIMVERPRKHYPPGSDWRVYRVSLTTPGKKTMKGKDMTFPEAELCKKSQPYSEGVKYVICKGKLGSIKLGSETEVYE